MIAMRLTELACPLLHAITGKLRQPTYDELLEMETDGHYDLPIDSLTDCMDLMQLVTGAKGVPQDRTQRLLILSLREKLMVHKLRHFGWLHTKDMCANNLTKPDLKDQSLNQLMDTGRFTTVDSAIVRKSGSKRTQFEERLISSRWTSQFISASRATADCS